MTATRPPSEDPDKSSICTERADYPLCRSPTIDDMKAIDQVIHRMYEAWRRVSSQRKSI